MHTPIVVVEISLIGLIVESLFLLRHSAEIFNIIRIGQSESLSRLGELGNDEVAVAIGLGHIAGTGIHQIHIEVCIKAIDIVGIVSHEAVELIAGSRGVVEFVFQNDAHIVEPLLNDVVGRGTFLVVSRNLTQIIFGVMGVGGMFARLAVGSSLAAFAIG